MGLQADRADTVFYYKKNTYHIEFKTPTGRQSINQKRWEERIKQQGFAYYIIRSKENFIKIIESILA